MTPIFYIKNGNLSFADKIVLSALDLYIYPGNKICLVGKNGSGKSSLMKIIQGEYELDDGELFQDPSTQIGYLKQDINSNSSGTIYDLLLKEYENIEDEVRDYKFQADIILNKLELDGNLNLNNCSGGQIRRASLAKTLIKQPEILLLDEPTNHLDIRAIEWLEEYVKSYQGAIICISHDRAFLENVTNKIWWIDRGILRTSDKGFKYYDQWREEVVIEEEATLRRMNRKLEAERNWLGTGVTARRKRNQKRLANLHQLRETLKNHQEKLNQAKSRLKIELAEEDRQAKFIIEAENISFKYNNKNILDDFSIKVKKGEKIGVIGPNGSGKSTLIKILIKELLPENGKIIHGTNLDITYFDQHRTALDPNVSILLTLCPSGGDQIYLKDRIMHVAAYMKNFMFDPKLLHAKVSTLSGGERNRLLLAKSLINPGNLLILDEPTNDLDMDSLEILLEILADYSGTLMIVSHDRDFLERLVTRTLVFGEDNIIDLYGGYEDYLKYYKKSELNIANKSRKIKKVEFEPAKIISKPNKLSYKYQRLLEVLPSQIEDLEQDIVALEKKLAAPNLYSSAPEKFNLLSEELLKAREDLDKKMNEWMELENMSQDL